MLRWTLADLQLRARRSSGHPAPWPAKLCTAGCRCLTSCLSWARSCRGEVAAARGQALVLWWEAGGSGPHKVSTGGSPLPSAVTSLMRQHRLQTRRQR